MQEYHSIVGGSSVTLGRNILILGAEDVDRLLDAATCVAAVEAAFRTRGPTAVLGVHVPGGGFHVKAAASPDFQYFVAKINANFPGNPDRHGLPTIQGTVTLFDGHTGVPLAIMDTVRITALRTAAASAVAAKYLARPGASRLAVIGCGVQAGPHVDAIRAVRAISHVRLFDTNQARAHALAEVVGAEVCDSVVSATRGSDIVVTCTPSRGPILGRGDVSPGTFIAAVGTDNEHKQEIAPTLMAEAKVVVDLLEQCVAMGDLRGAIAAGAMRPGDVHAELADVISGSRPGRSTEDEIIVFDSTGVAFEDVAAAAAVYERSRRSTG